MIISVYKPCGWTSSDVVQKIKHGCGFKRVGHAGTLDPLAEGVLIVLTNEDTKRQDEFMGMPKKYLVKMALGFESDSHDLGTPVRLVDADVAVKVSAGSFDLALKKYVGLIQQQVPMYSAVHVGGKRLYKSARDVNSAPVEAPFRTVEISDINVCSFVNDEHTNYPYKVVAEISVLCSKGTYIRSLVRDLGNDLKCGAVTLSLIRTKVGDCAVEEALTIEEVLLNCQVKS